MRSGREDAACHGEVRPASTGLSPVSTGTGAGAVRVMERLCRGEPACRAGGRCASPSGGCTTPLAPPPPAPAPPAPTPRLPVLGHGECLPAQSKQCRRRRENPWRLKRQCRALLHPGATRVQQRGGRRPRGPLVAGGVPPPMLGSTELGHVPIGTGSRNTAPDATGDIQEPKQAPNRPTRPTRPTRAGS